MNSAPRIEALDAAMSPITSLVVITYPDQALATDIASFWLDATSADLGATGVRNFAAIAESTTSFIGRNEHDEMVAIASWRPDEGLGIAHLEFAATREAERGRGLGRFIVRTGENFMREQGIDVFTVRAKGDSAGFYEALFYKLQPSGLHRKNAAGISRSKK